MSKYADAFQQLHESDLHHQHSSLDLGYYNQKCTSCPKLVCPYPPTYTRVYGRPLMLNVVEEHPPQVVCDCPHVLLEYDVKLSPVGQL